MLNNRDDKAADAAGAPPVTGLILAGGAGRRMGGADKTLLHLDGRPLIEHVLARLDGQVDRCLISANRNLARYREYGTVVTDTLPDHAGPLAGVLAALHVLPANWLFVCAGDAPGLPRNLVVRLRAAVRDNAANGRATIRLVTLHDGERAQPLPFLVHPALRGHLEAYLAAGGRSVHDWQHALPGHQKVAVTLNDPDTFRSLNVPADFAQASICDCR